MLMLIIAKSSDRLLRGSSPALSAAFHCRGVCWSYTSPPPPHMSGYVLQLYSQPSFIGMALLTHLVKCHAPTADPAACIALIKSA